MPLTLAVASASRTRFPMGAFIAYSSRMNTAPRARLIAYVHVPKTGGTSIRSHLRNHGGHGVVIGSGAVTEPQQIAEANWITGHVTASRFIRLATALQRDITLSGSCREPRQRIISFINHKLRSQDNVPEGRISGRDPGRGKFRQDLRATDFQSPDSVRRLLLSDPALFQEQTQYLLGPDWTIGRPSDDFIDAGLAAFDMIAPYDRPELLTALFGFAETGMMDPPHENAAEYAFDPAVFAEPLIRDCFDEYLETESRVYERSLKMFAPGLPEREVRDRHCPV